MASDSRDRPPEVDEARNTERSGEAPVEGEARRPDRSGIDAPLLEDLLAECVERFEREGERAVAEVGARHPEQAEALRQALAPLVKSGVVGPAPDQDPSHIGGCAVRRRLGEGAFGIVYLCTQTEPIRREVAIKVLRPGAGDRGTLMRFDAERHVLAMMSHPAVASVFDAGVLPDGRPFFVMEFVDGVPITKYCDQHRLAIEDRLALFLALCDGVQSAHQRGVIHRDLKPSNVLVQDQIGRPQPKIIDFGLAKALHRPEPENPLLTEAGRVLGTPGFMSPEQALGRGADVDTRSDVFALGVILYLMLTGEMPWHTHRPQVSTTPQRPSTPPRPSTRVASESGQRSTTAALRSTEPRQLVSRLRGDLDWIVLRALESDRERRYASVLDLATDLRRHLRHEPVLAGPPALAYRLAKFVRRHRVPVLAAVAVFVTLLGGLFTAWSFALQAQTNLDRFEILAISSRLRRAKAAAATLHPSWPERLPDIDRWLHEHGQPLARELPRLQTALVELRERALPLTEADRAEDRRTNPWTAEHASQQARLAYFDALLNHPTLQQESFAELRGTLERMGEQTRNDLAVAAQRAGERGLWCLPDGGQQFLHDTVTQLLRELTDFAEGPRSFVARQQATRDAIADEVRAQEAQRALWDQVAAEVAGDPRYGGLRLRPQAWLVPLGCDPHSGLHEFYHAASAPPGTLVPSRDLAGNLQLGVDDGIVFVLLAGGEAWIGAQRDDPAAPCYDPGATLAESPVHRVTLAPFFLAKHEVTQAQWLQLTGTKPSVFHDKTTTGEGVPISRRHPVENLTWEESKAGLERHGLDLPTEAQWEFGCRAGTTTTWPTGDERASLVGFAHVGDPTGEDVPRSTHHDPVGTCKPNGFGLHDMVGNVAEWCRDYFSSLAYLLPAEGGDGARPVPLMQVRALRGGTFQDAPSEGSSAARNAKPFNHRSEWLGVRAARRVEPAR